MVAKPPFRPDSDHLPFRLREHPSLVFRRPSEGDLWLPERIGRPNPNTGLAFFTRQYVSFSNVYGGNPKWEDAVGRLRRYDLGTILNTLGHLSSAIHNAHGLNLLQVQADLVRWLFEEEADPVLRTGDEMLKEAEELGARNSAPVVFFHESQIINTAKIALLEVDRDHALETEAPTALGDALLVVNDLIGAQGTGRDLPKNPSTEEERGEWERFFLVNGFFHRASHPVPDLARTWDLYLTDRPQLQDSRAYQDFPELVEEITGLPPIQLWGRLFAAYSHWGKGPDPSTGSFPSPLNLETHFTENFNFDPREEEAFWSLVAGTPDELRGELRDHGCGEGELQPYHILPLEKRPLIRLEGQILCPSTTLMLRRMTTGLHHVFLNRIPDRDHRDRYLNYMGEVFEDYIVGVLEEQFGGMADRLITEEELKEAAPEGSSVCDAILVYPEGILLVEVKAKRLPLVARVHGDTEELDGVFHDVFLASAGQLDSVVRLIKAGSLTGLGLQPHKIRRHVPISVTLDPLPMNPFTYDRLSQQLADEGILQQDGVLPLQLLAAEDVEIFEIATARGRNVLDLLADRVAVGAHRFAGFLNHLAVRDDPLLQDPHPRLRERFEGLVEEVVDLFEERKR